MTISHHKYGLTGNAKRALNLVDKNDPAKVRQSQRTLVPEPSTILLLGMGSWAGPSWRGAEEGRPSAFPASIWAETRKAALPGNLSRLKKRQ